MRHHCLVASENRCAAPVLAHKGRIFGMSNEQVLCIIHLCSIFHVEEQESGFWSLLRAVSALCAPLQEVFQCDQIFGNDLCEHTVHAYIKYMVYLPTMDKVFYI